MKTIYLDVLIVLNIYVNFFLLKATAKFTHISLRIGRCIISAVIGSVFSLTILLPDPGFIISMTIKLIAAAIIVLIAFGLKDKKSFLRLLVYFYIINFIFAGVVGFFYIAFNPAFVTVKNTYFYIDFSILSLVIFTAFAYFAVTAVRRLIDKGADSSREYSITIKYNQNTITCDALADTGNSLIDAFTGKPVIICPQQKLKIEDDFSSCEAEEIFEKYGFRMIAYSTIGNTGLIPVLTPDEVVITDKEGQRKFNVEALIGIINRETPVIFNPKLLL